MMRFSVSLFMWPFMSPPSVTWHSAGVPDDPESSTAATELERTGLGEGMDPQLAPFFHAWLDTFIFHGRLDPKLRQVTILRVMWRCGQAFEYGNHYRIARNVGVTRNEVLAVRSPTPEQDLDGDIAVVVRAADEVVDDGRSSEGTMQGRAAVSAGRRRHEFVYLVAGSRMVATVGASRREEREPTRAPWPPDGVGPAEFTAA